MYQRFIFQFFWKIKKKKTEVTLSLILRFNLRLGVTPYGVRVLRAPYMIKISGLEHLTASEQPEVLVGLLDVSKWRPRRRSDYLKYSKTTSQVLDACRTRLRRARRLVRPGAARLLIGIECSRVRNSSWMYLTSFVTTRIGVRTSCNIKKTTRLCCSRVPTVLG